MSLTDSLGLGGIFGNQASQGSIQNLPAQTTQLGQGMWVTTTSNTSGLLQNQTYNSAIQGALINPQLTALEQDVALVKYILQRTVPNYDEIVKQFNAIEDIKGAEQWDR